MTTTTAPLETLDAHKVKQIVTGELGSKLDEQLTAQQRREQQFSGAASAFQQASQKLLLLHKHVQLELEDDKQESELYKVAGEPKLIAAYVKKWISRCSTSMDNLAVQAKATQVAASGAAGELAKSVKLIQNHHNAATARVLQITEAEEAAKKNGKNGFRPGDGSRRKEVKARMANEKTKKKTKRTATKKARKNKR